MSIYQAMQEAIESVGGYERAAFYLWPDKPLHRSEPRLRSCVDPEARDTLSPPDFLRLAEYAAEHECHAIMHCIADETGYPRPIHLPRAQRQAEEMKRFIRHANDCMDAFKEVQRLGEDLPFDEEAFEQARAERSDPKIVRREFAKVRQERYEALVERDGEHCQNCGTTEKLTIDHIQPVTRGGSNDLENLQILCGPCNTSKSDRVTLREVK